MPYFTRVFCRSESTPPLQVVLDAAGASGIPLVTAATPSCVDVHTETWTEVELLYNRERGPLVVECNRDNSISDSLVREECAEFMEDVELHAQYDVAAAVVAHLQATRTIIAIQLLFDINDSGYEANGFLLSYFAETCDGLIQADGEGIYDGGELLIPMD